jgi:hypothetical protein
MSIEGDQDPRIEGAKQPHGFGTRYLQPNPGGIEAISMIPALKERELHIERLHGIVVSQAQLIMKLSEQLAAQGEDEAGKGRRAL